MPQKKKVVRKVRKDKKQDNRIKKLESFIYKTIENKQVNFSDVARNITTGGYSTGGFLSLSVGAEDGSVLGDPARIGNTITLMSQTFNFNFISSATDTYNQLRVLLVESMDGNQPLSIGDILQYPSYTLHGNLVFTSPYTTKTNTNRRYKVHMDKSFVLSGLPTFGGAPPVKNIKHSIRWKNGKLCEYEGPGATSPTNHRVSLIVISDSSTLGHPQMNYSSRSSYKDA